MTMSFYSITLTSMATTSAPQEPAKLLIAALNLAHRSKNAIIAYIIPQSFFDTREADLVRAG